MAIADIRREYTLTGLRRADLDPDPITQFRRWFDQATGARASGRLRKWVLRLYKSVMLVAGMEPTEVNAMTLATADRQGRPSARVVLLKGVDARGFLFFTNYDSKKAQDLSENAAATLVFYWADQERQVCVTGEAHKLSRQESEAYFKTRPRGSQIGAWSSNQSHPIRDRRELEARWAEIETRFAAEVPTPPNWGGYVVKPNRIEFWQGRPNRLHDRFCYTLEPNGTWRLERLCP